MSNWKTQAKNMIAQADLLGCINLLKSNGINVGVLQNDAKALEDQSEKHVQNKTQMTSSEVNSRLDEFARIGRALITKINEA